MLGSHSLCRSSFRDFATSVGCFWRLVPPNRNAMAGRAVRNASDSGSQGTHEHHAKSKERIGCLRRSSKAPQTLGQGFVVRAAFFVGRLNCVSLFLDRQGSGDRFHRDGNPRAKTSPNQDETKTKAGPTPPKTSRMKDVYYHEISGLLFRRPRSMYLSLTHCDWAHNVAIDHPLDNCWG